MPQVLFVKRYGAHWPSACPVLSDEAANEAIEAGLAVPYSDEAREAVQAIVSAEPGIECVALPVHPAAPSLAVNVESATDEPTEVADETPAEAEPPRKRGRRS